MKSILTIRIVLFCVMFYSCESKKNSNYPLYNLNIAEADYLIHTGDSINAEIIMTREIYSIERPFLQDLRNLISLRIKLRKYENLDELINYSIKFGMTQAFLFCDDIIRTYYEETWNEKFFNFSKLRQDYLKNIDTTYRNTIINLINDYYSIYVTPKPISHYNSADNKETRTFNKVKNLIDEKGFFGFSRIGEDILFDNNCFNNTVFFFSFFEPDSNQKYFQNTLKRAVINGDMYPNSYANIIDRDYLKRDSFKTIYGTIGFFEKGKIYLFPVENFDNVNTLRKEIGLIDLNRFMEMTKLLYDTTLNFNYYDSCK